MFLMLGKIEIVHRWKLIQLVSLSWSASAGFQGLNSRYSLVGVRVVGGLSSTGSHTASLNRGFTLGHVILFPNSSGPLANISRHLRRQLIGASPCALILLLALHLAVDVAVILPRHPICFVSKLK